ncbi:MAG: class I adenylate-forming enzyme family protein [Rhizobiaceae bacterium]
MYHAQLTEAYFPAQEDLSVRDMTICDALGEAVGKWPDRPALSEVKIDGSTGRRWTYDEMVADAERLALALASRFEKGERVVVWAPNIPEWVLIEYACALSGIILVTANPAFQPKELRYVLEQSQASGLFLVGEYRGNPMADIAAEAINSIDPIREVIDLTDHDALYRDEGGATLPNIQPDDRAMMQYTSGTTGFPKGAVLSHSGLINNARHFMARLGTHEETKWSSHMPMFHTSGCGMATLGCVQFGAELFVVAMYEPNLILDLIEREKITAFIGVPTMIVQMLEAQERRPRDLSSIEIGCSGGSMVAPELVRAVTETIGCDFQTVYGQTECSPLVTQHWSEDALEDKCQTAGQPIAQTEVSIRSTTDNSVLGVGEVGEICVRSYAVMIEYFRDEEATARTIDAEGWLHTGDLGTLDSRGYVTITGRVKEMIIRGGENHFPAEIENVLLEHPSVSEAAIVGLPDQKWGEVISCFLTTKAGHAPDIAELKAHCRRHMSAQKTPTVWVHVKEFPLTGSGKIQKFALRDAYVDGTYQAVTS